MGDSFSAGLALGLMTAGIGDLSLWRPILRCQNRGGGGRRGEGGGGGRREGGGGRGEGGSNIRSTSTCIYIYSTAHAELKRESRVRALLLVSFNVWNLSTRRSDPSHLSAPALVFKLMHLYLVCMYMYMYMYLGVEFGSEVGLGAD